jgi:hypothetical protein
MPTPIADNTDAILERLLELTTQKEMQHICPVCKGAGWIVALVGTYPPIVCTSCKNPDGKPSP